MQQGGIFHQLQSRSHSSVNPKDAVQSLGGVSGHTVLKPGVGACALGRVGKACLSITVDLITGSTAVVYCYPWNMGAMTGLDLANNNLVESL
jgi:hypothetical protein